MRGKGRRLNRCRAALSIVAVLAGAVGARADGLGYIHAKPEAVTKAFGPEVAAKIFSNEYTAMRQEAVTRSARTIPGFECPTELQVTLADVTPYPIKPATVSWIEGYIVACRPAARRSFLLLLDADKARIAELLPGSTMTDPLLQHDARHAAKAHVRALAPQGCEKATVTDTRVTEPSERTGEPWGERWSFDLCGTKAEVDMTFTPSPRGGATWVAKLVR